MRLSPNFTENEFRCKCGCGVSRAHPLLIWALEELRAAIGNRVITVTSGYRCPSHNKAVGGAPTSKHLDGMAADISVAGMTGIQIAQAAKAIPWFNGFGIAKGWAHLDVRDGARAVWRY